MRKPARKFYLYGSNATIEIEHGSGWAEEEIKRAKFNFTLENCEGQDKFSSGQSALQREEVELTEPFLI